MQILTKDGFRELPEEEAIGAYSSYMMMPIERARNFFRVVMQGRQLFPVQGLGFVIPNGIDLEVESV